MGFFPSRRDSGADSELAAPSRADARNASLGIILRLWVFLARSGSRATFTKRELRP